MALSSSESNLLQETCENMNVAAETCREVLEMLRSLGNTGVVDIATHNNASDAHANVKTIQHIDPAYNALRIGDAGDVSYYAGGTEKWGGAYATNISCATSDKKTGSVRYTYRQRAGGGTGSMFSGDVHNFAETDSSHNLTAMINASAYCKFEGNYKYWNSSESSEITKTTSIDFTTGPVGGHGDNNTTSIVFCLTNPDGVIGRTFALQYSNFIPYTGVTASIGVSSIPWDTAYFASAISTSSDRRGKDNVAALESNAFDFIKSLRPVQYTLKDGRQQAVGYDENREPTGVETEPGVRPHWGFIAQEVKAAMELAGIEDAAVWCLADKDDPNSKQSLRYEELIAPLVKAVQILATKVEALEAR